MVDITNILYHSVCNKTRQNGLTDFDCVSKDTLWCRYIR